MRLSVSSLKVRIQTLSEWKKTLYFEVHKWRSKYKISPSSYCLLSISFPLTLFLNLTLYRNGRETKRTLYFSLTHDMFAFLSSQTNDIAITRHLESQSLHGEESLPCPKKMLTQNEREKLCQTFSQSSPPFQFSSPLTSLSFSHLKSLT